MLVKSHPSSGREGVKSLEKVLPSFCRRIGFQLGSLRQVFKEVKTELVLRLFKQLLLSEKVSLQKFGDRLVC